MKVLLIGGTGMLGSDVLAELRSRGHEVVAPATEDLDITDPEEVAPVVQGEYDWCINCAAYTAVDKAEVEVDEATKVNSLAPGYLARACAMANIRLVHISTDFVFDGEASEPYGEDARTKPLGVYARSKRDGEEAVMAGHSNAIIVRTAWLYGPNGNCFPKTMINAWRAGKSLRVVSDQIGTPTYTADLARVLVDLIERDAEAGIYHAAGPGVLSWYEVARLAIETYKRFKGLDEPVSIEAIKSEDWPTPAERPKYSALATEKLGRMGIAPMRRTSEALAEFVRRLGD